MRYLMKFLREEEATTSVEYAVMLSLILMFALVAIGALGAQSTGMWGGVESDLRSVGFFGP